MTDNENLFADLSDDPFPDQILRLAKDLDRLIHDLEKQPVFDCGASYRIASLRYDINSAIQTILAINSIERFT